MSQLIGTWKLIAIEAHREDQITYPMGDRPPGYLMYLQNGHMSLLFSASTHDRSKTTRP